MTMTHKSNQ